jgi:5-methyltetrahydropteroyltriglutamate--homocysteine methyltransferase
MKALPILPTTVIGSYSLPPWLDHTRKARRDGVLDECAVREAHDNAVKSAIKDQELAGVDIVTDGELRRETMVYFFSSRIGGFDMSGRMIPIGNLDSSVQMPDPVIRSKVHSIGSLGMEDHFAFLRAHTDRMCKVCVTGPHMLAKRATDEHYLNDRALVNDLVDVLRMELQRIIAAGCEYIQIDEPVWVGHPADMHWLVESFNRLVVGLRAKIALHICYGNYLLKRLFTGGYEDLFPALMEAQAAQLSFEYATPDGFDLTLIEKYKIEKELIIGVIDVKDPEVETPEMIADRIREILRFVPAEKLTISPDCGMKFMPRDRAFAKLCAMTEGTKIVRAELGT